MSAPMRVYGSKISYYTGKLEAYLRYRSIPYEMGHYLKNRSRMKAGAGVVQMPVVELRDGRWMIDTTPMIAWLESSQDHPRIFPTDPAINFIALLIEDYADEWLWRSAMHYRWSYRTDRQYAAETLYEELMYGVLRVPRFIGLNMLKRRQYFGFVRGDGVNAESRAHADQTYLSVLGKLQVILEKRPFILGYVPTIADFGMMAPMFRHFSIDPTPARIMRDTAPAVYEWVARMWNTKADPNRDNRNFEIDAHLLSLLRETCETNLSQHEQNADAWTQQKGRFDLNIQESEYASVPVSRYRVWCLEQLREKWLSLDASVQKQLKDDILPPSAKVIWEDNHFAPSEYDIERKAPFNKGINVYRSGVP